MAHRFRSQNEAEKELYEQATAAGWKVMKRGWPDFFMVRGHQIALVEVKPGWRHRLKWTQALILERLSSFGIPCYRWDPESGFSRVGRDQVRVGGQRNGDAKP